MPKAAMDTTTRLESHIRALALPARQTRSLLRQSRSDDIEVLEALRGTLATHGVLVPARTVCTICCCELGEEPFQRLPCGHAYHAACLASMAGCGNAHVPLNNALTGLKHFNNDTFVTVSRWRAGVPSTLNKVVTDAATGASVLQPCPS